MKANAGQCFKVLSGGGVLGMMPRIRGGYFVCVFCTVILLKSILFIRGFLFCFRVSIGPISSFLMKIWKMLCPYTTHWLSEPPIITSGPTCSTCARPTGGSTCSKLREYHKQETLSFLVLFYTSTLLHLFYGNSNTCLYLSMSVL